jgi:hypothetical protein
MIFTNPPLWIWAIIVGMIIAGKFAFRWRAIKELAREAEEKSKKRREIDHSQQK